ncbi:MAG: D-alanine--D-alanine ligase [Bernardetiaceae bacterium]
MRVGIFFGGLSREREVSFAGAKTVFASLDRSLFEPVPVFVDGLGNFIKLDVRFLERDNIRSFYPSRQSLPERFQHYNLYMEAITDLDESQRIELMNKIGTRLDPRYFLDHFDFALLVLHGPYGEDGTLQGLLEWYNVPYSGCSILASSISINKELQRELEQGHPHRVISKNDWMLADKAELFATLKADLGLPLVIKAPYQGSSIGVSILRKDDLEMFTDAVHRCMFMKEVKKEFWQSLTKAEKKRYVAALIELDQEIGMPVVFLDSPLLGQQTGEIIFHHPDDLIAKLDDFFTYATKNAFLSAMDSEEKILFEQAIEGQEFSCGVIQDHEGKPVALPPTEIIPPSDQGFDFAAKYKTTIEKKLPMNASDAQIAQIQACCEAHFQHFRYSVCVRIDGFLTPEGKVILIDTNTIPGMSPTSLIFRQAAEIGLDPTGFLTYLVHTSLSERISAGKRPYHLRHLMHQLDQRLARKHAEQGQRQTRIILVPSYGDLSILALREARTLYTQLAANHGTLPHLVFVQQTAHQQYQLYQLPINFLLKASIRDIVQDLETAPAPVVERTRARTRAIVEKFCPNFLPLPKKLSVQDLTQLGDSAYMPVSEGGQLSLQLRKDLEKVGIMYHEA